MAGGLNIYVSSDLSSEDIERSVICAPWNGTCPTPDAEFSGTLILHIFISILLVVIICSLYTIQCIGFWMGWNNTFSLSIPFSNIPWFSIVSMSNFRMTSWDSPRLPLPDSLLSHSPPHQNLALPGCVASSFITTQHPLGRFSALVIPKSTDPTFFFLNSTLMVLICFSWLNKTSVNHNPFPFLWLSIFCSISQIKQLNTKTLSFGNHVLCVSQNWNAYLFETSF